MDERCSSCGRAFRPDDGFCGNCGTPRAGKAAEPAASAASPAASAPRGAPPPPAATPVRPKAKSAARLIPMIIGFAVIPFVAFFALGDCGSAEGQMQVTGSPHGEWTFVTSGCASMQPYGLMGANLHGDGPNDGAVYVTLDHAQGHKVELEVPGSCQNSDGTDCTVFEVPRASCETWDVTVDYTNTTVNDVRLVEGHVTLGCTLPDGAQVSGSIVFDGC